MKASPLRKFLVPVFFVASMGAGTEANAASYDSSWDIPEQNTVIVQPENYPDSNLGNELSSVLAHNLKTATQWDGGGDVYKDVLEEMFEVGSELYALGIRIISNEQDESAQLQDIRSLLDLAAEHPAMKRINNVDMLTRSAIRVVGFPLSRDEEAGLRDIVETHRDALGKIVSNIWMTAAFTGSLEGEFAVQQREILRELFFQIYEELGYKFSSESPNRLRYLEPN